MSSCRDADTKRSTGAEEAKAISGSKAGSDNGWIEPTFCIEVIKIYWLSDREESDTERAGATAGNKAGSGKQCRQQEAKQTGVVDVETWNRQRSVRGVLMQRELPRQR